MTTLPFVEGNASEDNLVEDYASEDYSNWTEAAAPDSNLVESMYHDAVPDVSIDEYVLAHAASTIEAENAIEQSVVGEAVEAHATLESELAVEEEEDTMSEWSEEDENVTSEYLEETWVESEYEDMISEGSEEAFEDEAWVAGEEGLAIQESTEANAPFQEASALFDDVETWLAGEDVMIVNSAQLQAYCLLEEETWLASERAFIEASAALYTLFEVGTRVAIEESAQEAVEAVTATISIPAATSTSLIPMWSSTVIEGTVDSTIPTHD